MAGFKIYLKKDLIEFAPVLNVEHEGLEESRMAQEF